MVEEHSSAKLEDYMNISYTTAWRISYLSILAMIITRMAPPLSWAQTQFLFSYEAGFQRRALLGELLVWIFPQGLTEKNTYVIAAIITLLAVAVLFSYISSSYSRLENGGVLLVLFSFSAGLGTLIGDTGYLDGILLILAILTLVITMDSVARVAVASLICIVGAMFHENMLPFFVPLVMLNIWLQNDTRPMLERTMLTAVPLVTTSIAVALFFAYGTHSYDVADSLLHLMQSRSLDFDIRIDTLEPIIDFPDGVERHLDSVWTKWYYTFQLVVFGAAGLVLLLAFFWIINRPIAHRPILDRVFIILAIISPISLLFVAFDISRFIAIALLNVFIAIAILSRLDQKFREKLPKAITPTVLIALMVLQSHIALRDLNIRGHYLTTFPGVLMLQKSWF